MRCMVSGSWGSRGFRRRCKLEHFGGEAGVDADPEEVFSWTKSVLASWPIWRWAMFW